MAYKVKYDELPDEVREALEEREVSVIQAISRTPKELFWEYCQWNGYLGSSCEELWDVIHGIKRACPEEPYELDAEKGVIEGPLTQPCDVTDLEYDFAETMVTLLNEAYQFGRETP